MTLGVSARHGGYWRWRAAAPSSAGAADRRAIHIVSKRDQPQQQENSRRGDDEDRGDAVVVGGEDRERGEQRDDGRRRDDIARRGQLPLRGDLVAEQHGHRDVVGAAERPQRKGKRGEQAINDRQRQHGRMQRRRDRQRNDRAEDARR